MPISNNRSYAVFAAVLYAHLQSAMQPYFVHHCPNIASQNTCFPISNVSIHIKSLLCTLLHAASISLCLKTDVSSCHVSAIFQPPQTPTAKLIPYTLQSVSTAA